MDDRQPDELSAAEIRGWAEFCCWSALAMAPVIYWLQGASVSHDQFVVRTALVVLAAAGGVGLRGYALLGRSRRPAVGDQAPTGPAAAVENRQTGGRSAGPHEGLAERGDARGA